MTHSPDITRLSADPSWAFHNDGSVFDLAAPDAASVCFVEIGKTLAGMRRFNGRGISIAQHSVMGAQAISNEGGTPLEAALFLLHDGHEWAIGDIIRPVEKVIASLPGAGAVRDALSMIKGRWDEAIYAAASLPVPEFWTTRQKRAVKSMDDRMCRQEAIEIFGPNAASQFPKSEKPKTTGTFRLWGEAKAEEEFARMAHGLLTSSVIARQAAIAARKRQAR